MLQKYNSRPLMKLRIFLSVLFFFGAFFTLYKLTEVHTTNFYHPHIKKYEDLGIKHIQMSNTYLVTKHPLLTEIKRVLQYESILIEDIAINNKNGVDYHHAIMKQYKSFPGNLINGLYWRMRLDKKELIPISGKAGVLALCEISSYISFILEIHQSLHGCSEYIFGAQSPKAISRYHYEKTYELFEIKNVNLYKKVKRHLAFGEKQEAIMALIDTILMMLFKMSNHCVSRYYSYLSHEQRILGISKLVDINIGSVEKILTHRQYKGRRITSKEINQEL